MQPPVSSRAVTPQKILGEPSSRALRLGLILLGLLVGQFVLYGPSLVGTKILLPLDLLALPETYLPLTPEQPPSVPHDAIRSDVLYQFETARRFVAGELREGRFPMWLPYQYAGVPMVWPRFSPAILLSCLSPAPVMVAWGQLVAAVIGGLGAYVFFRRTVGTSFWAAAIPSWCYPLTGFLVLWQGNPTEGSVYWFPWLMFAVDRVVRRPQVISVAGLGGATALVLISGHIDVAGQTLMASGLFAGWSVWSVFRASWFGRAARRAMVFAVLGWGLGFLWAAPHLLPLLDYARGGARVERRHLGEEERPPVGWSALPQVVLPDLNGSTRSGSLWLVDGNQIESSAAAYAGLIATLFVAPFAWCSRRHRAFTVFSTVLAVLGLSWCLNMPGLVDVWRLPVIHMMSHNRLVFWTSLAILAQAAIGLDVLQQGVRRRRWFALPAALLLTLGVWSVSRAIAPPEPVATQLGELVSQGNAIGWIQDLGGVREVQQWFWRANIVAAVWCLGGVAAWACVAVGWGHRRWFLATVGALMVVDLLWFSFGRSVQCDPGLYFPRVPMLDEIAKAPPGRVIGYGCLPAPIAMMSGLRDIRGYDSIDPARLMDLMESAADPETIRLSYAMTQRFVPRADIVLPDSVRFSPVLDLLDVRYVVFRGTPPPRVRPVFQSPDYWALVNPRAVGRVFVPAHVSYVADKDQVLANVTSASFDPRQSAIVESAVTLPSAIRGGATIVSETPTRIVISAKMETPGLVVLTDAWDKGWRAYLDGKPVPVLRTDYVLRGLTVLSGESTVEFRYEPESFALGLWLAVGATVLLAGGWGLHRRKLRSSR